MLAVTRRGRRCRLRWSRCVPTFHFFDASLKLTRCFEQALCLLTTVEMGKGDHQRAFLTIGQAVRISAMLGLHRMDEDRIAGLQSMTSDRRLRPPALHILPEDPLLLEECRRTMCVLLLPLLSFAKLILCSTRCTVFVLDRFEAACIGWPATIAEGDIRLLLPCAEPAFEAGTCSSHDNPLWWPTAPRTMENEEETGPSVGSFAWLCRVVWFGGRIQAETYRPSGAFFFASGGDWVRRELTELVSPQGSLPMDRLGSTG